MKLLFVILCAMCNASAVQFPSEAKVLTDLITNLNKPVMLHMKLGCWKRKELHALTKLLHVAGNFRTRKLLKEGFTNFHLASERIVFLVDFNCKQDMEVLRIANKTDLFMDPYTWIAVPTMNAERFIIETHLKLLASSRFYVINQLNVHSFDINLYYKLPSISAYQKNYVGHWRAGKFDGEFVRVYDAMHRRNLQNIAINCSAVVLHYASTKHHLLDGRFPNLDQHFKCAYPMIIAVSQFGNFTLNVRFMSSWGYRAPNGTYDGMMGEYIDGVSDVSAGVLLVLPDRMIHVTSFYGLDIKATFVFKAPRLSYVRNIYMLPFSLSVWLACIATFACCFGALYMIAYQEERVPELQQHTNANMQHLNANPSDLLHVDISCMCQQGMEAEPSSNGGRIATYIILLSMLFLFTAYSANIVTLLQARSDSINSMEALYKSKLKVGVQNIAWAMYHFKMAPEKVMQALYKEKLQFINAEEGIRRVRYEYYAFHAETTVLYKLIQDNFYEEEKCGLMEVAYIKTVPYFGCRRKSPYREIFAAGYRKLKEYGLNYREVRRIYVPKPTCAGGVGTFSSADLVDTYASYLIYGLGLAICLTVFVLEHIVFYKKNGQFFIQITKSSFRKFIIVKKLFKIVK